MYVTGSLDLLPHDRLLVLTGAGISVESGMRAFRGADGLWEGQRVEDVATPQGFGRDPDRVWNFYSGLRHKAPSVEPNAAHLALSACEERLGARHEFERPDQRLAERPEPLVDRLVEGLESGQARGRHGDFNPAGEPWRLSRSGHQGRDRDRYPHPARWWHAAGQGRGRSPGGPGPAAAPGGATTASTVATLLTPAATNSTSRVPASVKPEDRALCAQILKSVGGNASAALAALAAIEAKEAPEG